MLSIPKWFDPNNIYDLHFKVYAISLYWKVKSSSKRNQLIYDFFYYVAHIGLDIQIIALLIDIYVMRHDFEKISTNIGSSILYFAAFVKVWIFNIKRDKVEKICNKFENNFYLPQVGKSKADKDITEKYAVIMTKVSAILWGTNIFLFIFWGTFPLLDQGSERRYPVPFPVYNAESPIYEIIYVFETVVFISIAFNIFTFEMIFFGFIARVCAQYEIVAKNISGIKNLLNDDRIGQLSREWRTYEELEEIRNEEVAKIIKQNVIHHTEILKQIKDIEDIFSIPIFIVIAGGASLMAVVACEIMMKSEGLTAEQMQRIFYVVGALSDTGLYCYFGNQLEIKSNRLNEALYDNSWYEMKIEIRKLYMIMMANLQRKVIIRGGGMFPATLQTYKQILKASYDLIAIFRHTSSRN